MGPTRVQCIVITVWSLLISLTAADEVQTKPFAWQSPEWHVTHPRLVGLLRDQDYQGMHGIPLPAWEPKSLLGGLMDAMSWSRPPLQYHMVLTSCNRPHWGRHLVTTLMSSWLHEAQPLTLSVMWCRPYDADAAMPSLFYDLRHSETFRLLHVPPEQASGIPISPAATYWWALVVPHYYRRPDVPLLLMEDDTVLHPQFHQILCRASRDIETKYGATYMLNMYVPGEIANASFLLQDSRYNASSRPEFAAHVNDDLLKGDRHGGRGELAAYRTMHQGGTDAWAWGVQAQLYSAGMRLELARHYWEVLTGAYVPPDGVPGYQDMYVFDYVYKRRRDERRSAVFGIRPSLVEHAGAASGVFGGVSGRFHLSQDFPFFVRMPWLDLDMDW